MEHLLFSEIASALFLLLLGAARYHYFISANSQSVDRSSPPVNWARHVPAYFVSSVWAIYVAWLVVAPSSAVRWDRWPVNHWFGELLGWIAIPILAAAFWLFWYSHDTIGRYWSMRVVLKTEHRLVTDGPYRHIRHPLYTALFLGYLGTVLALQSWMLVAWLPIFVIAYCVFAKEEEKVMERGFGEAYRAYRLQAGMFLPKWPKRLAGAFSAARRSRARTNDHMETDEG